MRRKEKDRLYERLENIEREMAEIEARQISLAIAVTKMAAPKTPIPDEPPDMTVIIGNGGWAFQNQKGRWYASGDEDGWTWADLNRLYSPLNAVYIPGEIN